MRHAAALIMLAVVGLSLALFAAANALDVTARALDYNGAHGRAMAAALQTLPPMKELSGSVIPRIVCVDPPDKRGKIWLMVGTGARIGPNLIMTADHVVLGALGCRADEAQATVVREYHDLDIAFLTAANPSGAYASVSCAGVRAGAEYQVSGYADGESYRRTAIWRGLNGRVADEGRTFDGLSRFEGLVRDGMSGGPIWERDTGRIVAIVNAGDEDPPHDVWGRALADTYLCDRRS